MRLEDLDDSFELVRDVKLMRVEHDDDEVGTLGEPAHYLLVVVVAPHVLFLPRQDPRRIDQGDVVEDRGVHLHALHAAEEVVAEDRQAPEGPVGLGAERRPRHDLVVPPVNDGGETVCGGFRSDPLSRKIPPQQLPFMHVTESRLSKIKDQR